MANLKNIFYEYYNLDLDFDYVSCIFGHPNPQYHHIVKKSQGGKDTGDNLAPLCASCHIDKHHNMNEITTEDIIIQKSLIYTPF